MTRAGSATNAAAGSAGGPEKARRPRQDERLRDGDAGADVNEPIRAELFGVERLEQHAESLALAQRVLDESAKGRRLLPRVEDNGRVLRQAYRAITRAIREERAITHAAEWLVDNFHVVDEQLREIRDDLPAGFYRKLPKLAEGPLAG